MLVNQLVSVRDVAPDGCQLVYLVTEVLFLAMLQVIGYFAQISSRNALGKRILTVY